MYFIYFFHYRHHHQDTRLITRLSFTKAIHGVIQAKSILHKSYKWNPHSLHRSIFALLPVSWLDQWGTQRDEPYPRRHSTQQSRWNAPRWRSPTGRPPGVYCMGCGTLSPRGSWNSCWSSVHRVSLLRGLPTLSKRRVKRTWGRVILWYGGQRDRQLPTLELWPSSLSAHPLSPPPQPHPSVPFTRTCSES